MKVFIDTSAWISYYLPKEVGHTVIDKEVNRLVKEGHYLFTSNDIIDEAVTRLVRHHHLPGVEKFIDYLEKAIRERFLVQLWIDEEVQRDAFRLVEKFYEHRLSLTDATSMALMKRFKIDAILTLDEDFRKVGAKVLP